jgi:hypothetical protein
MTKHIFYSWPNDISRHERMILKTIIQAWPCDGLTQMLSRIASVPITEHIWLLLYVDSLELRV